MLAVVLRNAELWLLWHCQSSVKFEFWASLPHPCTAKCIQLQRNATQRNATTRKRLVCTVTPDDDACSGLDHSSTGNDIGGSISIGSGNAVVSTPPLPGWLIKQSSRNPCQWLQTMRQAMYRTRAFTCLSSHPAWSWLIVCASSINSGTAIKLSQSHSLAAASLLCTTQTLSVFTSPAFTSMLFSIFLTPPLASPRLLRLFWSPVA